MSYKRMTATIGGWMEEGFFRHSGGDDFTYETIPALMQVQQLPGAQPEPVLIMVAILPGTILGTSFHYEIVLYNPALVEPQFVIDKVQEMCEGLRNMRSQALRQAQAELGANGFPNLESLPPL